VRNGADAVYFGLDLGLNARARAANFSQEELPRVMSYLHARGVKAYVTLNTLVFDHELFGSPSGLAFGGGSALEALKCVASAGVDAIIVQDVGLALACRRLCPGLPVHASTQMSVTSAPGALFANRMLGATRVVLGRELSAAEVAAVVRDAPGVELEVFVHGALCVSYSGQCFSSEAWGGRSANRGQCAQACRMPYGLVRDGDLVGLGDAERYLLSPQDLMALDHVAALTKAGVGCFKIEGRLKGEEYVALTTASYRAAVDAAWATVHDEAGAEDEGRRFGGRGAPLLAEREVQRSALAQVFARGQDAEHDGLSPGFLEGTRHQLVVRGRAPKHRGLFAGTVAQVDAPLAAVTLRLSAAVAASPLQRGAGLVFDGSARNVVPAGPGSGEAREAGGLVQRILLPGGEDVDTTEGLGEGDEVVVHLNVPPGPQGASFTDLLRSTVQSGDLAWRSSDVALQAKLRRLWVRGLPGMELTAAVSGAEGEPLTVELTDTLGNTGVGQSDSLLAPAARHALDQASLHQVLKLRAGGPPQDPEGLGKGFDDGAARTGFWRLGADFDGGAGIDVDGLETGLFLPRSQVQRARQRAVQDLLDKRLRKPEHDGVPDAGSTEALTSMGSIVEPRLHLPVGWPSATAPESDDLGDEAARRGVAVPRLTVLCRSRAQADAVLALDGELVHEVQLDFLEANGLEEAVDAARAAGRQCAVCLPRVLKPGEDRLWRFYRRLKADALLVRSAGALYQLLELGSASGPPDGAGGVDPQAGGPSVLGDFSLNAANALSAAAFLGLPGLERLTPTHDLNAAQICELARGLGPARAARLEVVAHQHLPIFHTEHCVFCRFLTKGNDFTDCGHPCERGSLHLRDSLGKDHRVLADMGCRNTVFNAEAQSAARDLDALVAAGIGFLRLELVDEPASAVQPLVEHYHGALRGTVSVDELWDFLAKLPDANDRPQGVGRGSLDGAAWRERAPGQLRPTAATARSR